MVKIPAISPAKQPPAMVAIEPGELIDPITGEILNRYDVDQLIDSFERIKQVNDRCYAVLLELRHAIAALTEGDAVTRRIKGRRRAAKVTMPDESFEQPILKELWNSHPELARQYMKIASLSVLMREFKKLVNTSSDQIDFVFFRDAMTKAARGRVGTPAVSIEV